MRNIGDGNKDTFFQNARCSALFKNSEEKSWYLDAITWETESGSRYSGRAIVLSVGETIRSNQYIKNFPFEPKTFVINVIEKEIAPDDWVFFVKDESQLEKVFEYYEPIPINRKVIIEKINNSLL